MHDGTASARDARLVGRWLAVFAAMIVAIILVGGATRLTESGLSITEWKPVSGIVPPIGEAAWEAEFAKYQRIPQYRLLNAGMTLGEFRQIYLWEYGHRLVARLVGLFFVLPLAWFAARRRLPARARRPVGLVLVLLLVQGAMGWWMVSSGLSVRTEVSQYRLALHLATALVILGITVWTAAGLLEERSERARRAARGGAGVAGALCALLALAFATATSGALVAGLRAGEVYNTFPLMAGRVTPPGYGQLGPWWRNLFENHGAVQFNHRVLALLTVGAVVAVWAACRRTDDRRLSRRLHLALAAALAQLALGVATLLLSVPIALGVAHQGGAVALLVALLLALHAAVPPAAAPAAAPAAVRGTAGAPARPAPQTDAA